jgi:Ser/Thr protein kinase RdoA (MazF antagonist)
MRQIALEAVRLWRGEPDSLLQVSDSANHVFSFFASGQPLFLRLTSSRDRTLEQIEAELNFINYLHRGRVGVSLPMPSANGQGVETIQNEDVPLFACVFEEAEGECFTFGSDEANRQHFRLRGRTLGRIHALARDYTPAAGRRRFGWEEDDLFHNIGRYLPQSEEIVLAEYSRLMEWLCAYPQDRDTFGLIHGDFGPTNFRYRNGALMVFDFDDCCYHWYAYDLAVTIYPHGWRKEAKGLMKALFEGYWEEAGSGVDLRNELAQFCRLRQLYMFLNYAKRWGLTNLSDQQASWFAQKRDNMARGYMLPA